MKFTTARAAWDYSHQHEDTTDPKCAGRQFEALELLADLGGRHRAGDTTALPYALAVCARHGLVMPDWLAEAVSLGITRWHDFEARSLDEALNVSRKGSRARDEQNYRKHRKAVFFAVLHMLEQGAPIDDGLFEQAVTSMANEFEQGKRQSPHSFSAGTYKRWFYRYLDESKAARLAFEVYKARK